jgi:putative hydrolase of the HAD superfamily
VTTRDPHPSIRAVIFDLGGVVLGSPLHAIAAYEREAGLPAGFVNRVVADTAPGGAWSRLERGELAMEAFFDAFETDCRKAGEAICARTMMGHIAAAAAPREPMLDAIRRIRARGLAVAALTNNWDTGDGESLGATRMQEHFDVVIESRREGLRKPDPRIYELCCARLDVAPAEAVFLDDIGSNLKTARALGMTTIKVDDPARALAELERTLGFALSDGDAA